MVKYESLLLGGKVKKSKMDSSSESEEEEEMMSMGKHMMGGKECTKERKETALKVARKVKSSLAKSECAYGRGAGVKGMTYEERCANLAKARATRMANLKKKKMGGGQYNQDYVDESQLNYAGSPLDIYYQIPEKQIRQIKEERGENVGGRMRKGGEMDADKLLEMGKTGGRMKKGKGLEKDMSKEYPVDLHGAIKHLSELAQKFGLRLVK